MFRAEEKASEKIAEISPGTPKGRLRRNNMQNANGGDDADVRIFECGCQCGCGAADADADAIVATCRR